MLVSIATRSVVEIFEERKDESFMGLIGMPWLYFVHGLWTR
jgi:hypothetical protein